MYYVHMYIYIYMYILPRVSESGRAGGVRPKPLRVSRGGALGRVIKYNVIYSIA